MDCVLRITTCCTYTRWGCGDSHYLLVVQSLWNYKREVEPCESEAKLPCFTINVYDGNKNTHFLKTIDLHHVKGFPVLLMILCILQLHTAVNHFQFVFLVWLWVRPGSLNKHTEVWLHIRSSGIRKEDFSTHVAIPLITCHSLASCIFNHSLLLSWINKLFSSGSHIWPIAKRQSSAASRRQPIVLLLPSFLKYDPLCTFSSFMPLLGPPSSFCHRHVLQTHQFHYSTSHKVSAVSV